MKMFLSHRRLRFRGVVLSGVGAVHSGSLEVIPCQMFVSEMLGKMFASFKCLARMNVPLLVHALCKVSSPWALIATGNAN